MDPDCGGSVGARNWLERLARLGVRLGGEGVRPERSARPASPWPIEEVVPGRWVQNAYGRCYVSVALRSTEARHGVVRLADWFDESAEALAMLANDPSLAGLDMSAAVFLDTETTGLVGGSGTYAFLIGMGRFDGPSFRVDQVFMADPSQEAAQLAQVAELVADSSWLITFNGRGFDLPLLATRYRLQRRTFPLEGRPHLDLLPVARRLFRRRLSSCALASLESWVLGVQRSNDVPGWMVPTRYFDYQHDGDARPLAPVFQHNVTDIVSMVSLATHLGRAFRRPSEVLRHAEDWLSLARCYSRYGLWAEAAAAGEAAFQAACHRAAAEEALHWLGQAARRCGEWQRAASAWQELIDLGCAELGPFEELAKYYEHYAPQRDPRRALAVVERAQALLGAGRLRPSRGVSAAARDLERRRLRLLRKLDQAAR